MITLENKQRERLSGILANFAQIILGSLFVSNFFKDGSEIIRAIAVVAVVTCTVFSVALERKE